MKIGESQIKLLNLATQYYKKLGSVGVDVAESAYCWLLNVPGAPGYFILKNLKENEIISAHKHTPKLATINITQESLIVIKGSINVSLYDVNDHIITEYKLKQSDCVITFRGGHKYEVLSSDALVYEHKTGPYLGIDKKMIE